MLGSRPQKRHAARLETLATSLPRRWEFLVQTSARHPHWSQESKRTIATAREPQRSTGRRLRSGRPKGHTGISEGWKISFLVARQTVCAIESAQLRILIDDWR